MCLLTSFACASLCHHPHLSSRRSSSSEGGTRQRGPRCKSGTHACSIPNLICLLVSSLSSGGNAVLKMAAVDQRYQDHRLNCGSVAADVCNSRRIYLFRGNTAFSFSTRIDFEVQHLLTREEHKCLVAKGTFALLSGDGVVPQVCAVGDLTIPLP